MQGHLEKHQGGHEVAGTRESMTEAFVIKVEECGWVGTSLIGQETKQRCWDLWLKGL